jgi:hypothetical protein
MVSRYLVAACALSAVLLASCGGGGGGSGSGSLRLALTDAPACGFDQVNINIVKVRIHQSSSASDNDAGWQDLTLSPAQCVNLLDLQNGVLQELGTLPLAPGKYEQMRLVLGTSGNTVVRTGSTVATPLETPSGAQSGLKMNVNIDVQPGRMADAVIDFDACRSVVTAGNSGRVQLKPVLRVTPRYVSGVVGQLDSALIAAGANVSLQQNGVVQRATQPDATGKFTLAYMAPGSYDLVLAAPGRATVVVSGVPVQSELVTTLNGAANPLSAPASATGVVQGTVNRLDASVRALQPFSASGNVEVASGLVDSETGRYGFTLPVAAPLVAPYAASLTFGAYTPAAGAYTMQGSLAGGTPTAATPVTLTAGATATRDITLP